MTDKEIIKALEHEIHIANDIGGVHSMMIPIEPIKCALDLINRQQAEIERLREFIEKDQGLILKLTSVPKDEYDNKIKAEAIKEFAERLTNIICEKLERSLDNLGGNNYFITDVYTDINNLVKEMTETQERND